ncbi:ABC transporter ATP-binding protein [Leekyejoonella antrihumi]|uniref:ABC transporter ATP-binding protein n=1 Tax=Leekyejoonella antrihumi TaxID=1660198 RepID=A0A563E2T6_9MICO|nr:ABC transporter ATP-binding protein [Leekyejoonella antrihumi]TWP36204.1 ABC transporter ATP-binding protein [Leekyejoonella antrihumi]
MIEANQLSKTYGDKVAVDSLTFTVEPGKVTGFLGPNGAGKSTTMRLILGLDRPTSGWVTVNGKAYADHPRPMAEVGALLEARAMHTSRTAYNHLRALAATHGISNQRVQEVIDLVGLGEVARKRTGGFSLGMGQRLGIACALLGDPRTVILDEPVNGLDPEGVRWVRDLLRNLCSEGRTVFLSSHLMSEMAMTADQLIIIGHGRLIADMSLEELIASVGADRVRVRTPDPDALTRALAGPHVKVSSEETGVLEVQGLPAPRIGELASQHGAVLHELTPLRASLEEAYMDMTKDAVEYHAISTTTSQDAA